MVKRFYSKIPSYQELKNLDKNYEYIFNLFGTIGSGYLRITYNEEYYGKISVDYLQDGFLHNISLPIRHKTTIIENKFYNLNKTNYKKIIKFIRLVRLAVLEELNKWESIEENSLKMN